MNKKKYTCPGICVVGIESESMLVTWTGGKVGDGAGDSFTTTDSFDSVDEGPGGDGYEYGAVEID